MEKIAFQKVGYCFDVEEKRKLIELVKYCRHRSLEHPESGIHKACNGYFIEYLLDNLEENEK